jgi:hypothetical protein
MYPTIEMTAVVLEYVKRLVNHAVGSGNVSKNHSWNFGGYLSNDQQLQSLKGIHMNSANIFVSKVLAACSAGRTLNLLKYSLNLAGLGSQCQLKSTIHG